MKFSNYLLITAKGICMGAADIIPGVSGGTIAFISGIYNELVSSLKSLNIAAAKLLLHGRFNAFWQYINGNFLFALFIGIFTSLLSLARLVKYLLQYYPILLWAFFFGLIVASVIVIIQRSKKFTWKNIIILVCGTIISYGLTILLPVETTNSYWFLFLCGAIAICAMILPGISGAFILLLLGKYSFVLQAVTEFDLLPLTIIALGAVLGLITFSNVLSFFLQKYYHSTIFFLTGIMLGSLNKVWPWKQVVASITDRHGEIKPLVEKSVLLTTYQNIYDSDPMLLWATLLAIVGFLLVFSIRKNFFKKTRLNMTLYGLIGYPLTHSFSKDYFTKKFKLEKIKATFTNFEIKNIKEFSTVISKNPTLKGLSVTIPYKEKIIPHIDELNCLARQVCAVNSVKIFKHNGKNITKGFNTDVFGFKRSLVNFLQNYLPESALVLGTGGVAKAVAVALEQLKISYQFVSRRQKTNAISYQQLDSKHLNSYQLIINTTPLGTFPNVNSCPNIPYHNLSNKHFLFDMTYNPPETLFLKKGKKYGAKIFNGLKMLQLQAEKSWEIWNK